MVINNNLFLYDSSINPENNPNKTQLEPFVKQFVAKHSYFKTRDIAIDYLSVNYQITFNDLEKDRAMIQKLISKIGKLLGPYIISGNIKKYNKKTYQVIK